ALDRTGWTASTNAPTRSSDLPAKALDGKLSTRFGTNEHQAPGLYLEVDLGYRQSFNELVMASPNSAHDYARGYLVQVSGNGSSWSTVANCTGTATPEVVSFPAQDAQYLRVMLTAGTTPWWWSVDELSLYGAADCSAPVSGYALGRQGWSASTNAPSSKVDAPANALDGNYSTRFSTNAHQAPGLELEVDMHARRNVDELVMASPSAPHDYARGYTVQVSGNGSSWSTVANCTGTATPEVVSFPAQVAQYLKVTLTASSASFWWSVDELNVYSSAPTTAPTTTTTTVPPVRTTTTSLSLSPNPVQIDETAAYTATVSPPPTGGAVTFTDNGAPLAGCGAMPVHGGKATCPASYLAGGDHAVQAFYSGATGFRRSASGLVTEVVSLPPTGYWLATQSGGVVGLGGARSLGGVATSASTGSVVGIAGTPSGRGYWVATARGAVSSFGDAKSYGDLPSLHVATKDIVAIAPTADGHGYWLVGRDGGMFAFGDARFHGSVPGLHLHVHDVVGMVASPDGGGYLVVGSDGGVFTFGSAHFYGSIPGLHKHVRDIRAILPSSTGKGYVLVGADGGAFVFGSGVHFLGSLPGRGISAHDIVGIALTPDDGGYFMAAANGSVYGFGDANPWPTPGGLNLPVVAIAGT
ncbi:MAG: discoidin domain-containing protein, partial [Acidimicrobiales bacterium]